MPDNRPGLVFGPAYLDLVVETDRPLAPDLLDQSVPAARLLPRDDSVLELRGPTGDRLQFHLPTEAASLAATYELCEPILARLRGMATRETVNGDLSVSRVLRQLGGMGAGYAKALGGILRVPFGGTPAHPDQTAMVVLQLLRELRIHAEPVFLPDSTSDSSLIVLSPRGDKLAVGVRAAMVRWQANAADRELIARASAVVFCGAPNALLTELLPATPEIPIMCAPAMRNIADTACPLADLAGRLHYLTLNALEWEHLAGKERLLRATPIITVTDGPHGSRIYVRGEELFVPAVPHNGLTDVNRAGETYGASVFKVLRQACPQFFHDGLTLALAKRAGQYAARQAERQLGLTAFEFPPDEFG